MSQNSALNLEESSLHSEDLAQERLIMAIAKMIVEQSTLAESELPHRLKEDIRKELERILGGISLLPADDEVNTDVSGQAPLTETTELRRTFDTDPDDLI